jgi:hypothetical protein
MGPILGGRLDVRGWPAAAARRNIGSVKPPRRHAAIRLALTGALTLGIAGTAAASQPQTARGFVPGGCPGFPAEHGYWIGPICSVPVPEPPGWKAVYLAPTRATPWGEATLGACAYAPDLYGFWYRPPESSGLPPVCLVLHRPQVTGTPPPPAPTPPGALPNPFGGMTVGACPGAPDSPGVWVTPPPTLPPGGYYNQFGQVCIFAGRPMPSGTPRPPHPSCDAWAATIARLRERRAAARRIRVARVRAARVAALSRSMVGYAALRRAGGCGPLTASR